MLLISVQIKRKRLYAIMHDNIASYALGKCNSSETIVNQDTKYRYFVLFYSDIALHYTYM